VAAAVVVEATTNNSIQRAELTLEFEILKLNCLKLSTVECTELGSERHLEIVERGELCMYMHISLCMHMHISH
jgi:hypothetical protein